MSESLGAASNIDGAEKSCQRPRIIDAITLYDGTVRLALTRHGKNVTQAYVLCTLDDSDSGAEIPERAFDIPTTDLGLLPAIFEFPKPQDVFSFRMVLSECGQDGREMHTVHPGLVQDELALIMDFGWTIPLL